MAEVRNCSSKAIKRCNLQYTENDFKSSYHLASGLVKTKLMDGNKMGIFHKLRELRNYSAHATDFTLDTESAIEFSDMAIRLADYLDNAK